MANNRINFSNLSSGIIIPVLIVIGLVVAYFAVWPKYHALKESKAKLAAKLASVSERKASVDSIKALVADLEKKRAALSAMDEALPSAPDIPGLLANIEYLANQSGMALENLQVQSAVTADPSGQVKKQENKTGSIVINMSVLGQYPQLQALILNIEKNLRLLDVKSINFSQLDAETGDRSYALQLATYYQKP